MMHKQPDPEVAGKGRRARSREGSVMLEFALAFPIVLVLILGCVQFAHLWVARVVVHYAAYCAARAALVTVCDESGPSKSNDSWPTRQELPYDGFQQMYCKNDSIGLGRDGFANSEAEWAANQAASEVCAWVVMGAETVSPSDDLLIPNWGRIPGTDAAVRKTRATIGVQGWNVIATVEHDFALIVPFVGLMIGWGMNPWDESDPWHIQTKDMTMDVHKGIDLVPYPHIRLTETVLMPKPYKTDIAAGDWDGYPSTAHSGSGW